MSGINVEEVTKAAAEVANLEKALIAAKTRLLQLAGADGVSLGSIPQFQDPESLRPKRMPMYRVVIDFVKKAGKPIDVNAAFEELRKQGYHTDKGTVRQSMYRAVKEKELKRAPGKKLLTVG